MDIYHQCSLTCTSCSLHTIWDTSSDMDDEVLSMYMGAMGVHCFATDYLYTVSELGFLPFLWLTNNLAATLRLQANHGWGCDCKTLYRAQIGPRGPIKNVCRYYWRIALGQSKQNRQRESAPTHECIPRKERRIFLSLCVCIFNTRIRGNLHTVNLGNLKAFTHVNLPCAIITHQWPCFLCVSSARETERE